jgi:hypothetical protein
MSKRMAETEEWVFWVIGLSSHSRTFHRESVGRWSPERGDVKSGQREKHRFPRADTRERERRMPIGIMREAAWTRLGSAGSAAPQILVVTADARGDVADKKKGQHLTLAGPERTPGCLGGRRSLCDGLSHSGTALLLSHRKRCVAPDASADVTAPAATIAFGETVCFRARVDRFNAVAILGQVASSVTRGEVRCDDRRK